MIYDAIDLCNQAISAVLGWFSYIMEQMDAWPVIWAVLASMLVFRFIILPLFEGVRIKPDEAKVMDAEFREIKEETDAMDAEYDRQYEAKFGRKPD